MTSRWAPWFQNDLYRIGSCTSSALAKAFSSGFSPCASPTNSASRSRAFAMGSWGSFGKARKSGRCSGSMGSGSRSFQNRWVLDRFRRTGNGGGTPWFHKGSTGRAETSRIPTEQGNRTEPTETPWVVDRKSTRLNSSHSQISYAVFCLKKKNKTQTLQAPSFMAVSLYLWQCFASKSHVALVATGLLS